MTAIIRRKLRTLKRAIATAAIFLVIAVVSVSPRLLHATQQNAQQKEDINKSQAAERARQQVKGRVLKVEKKNNEYRVKVLQKSGRVVSVDVDKSSGKVKATPKKKGQ